MTATGPPRHEGSKPSASSSTVTTRLFLYRWIYPSLLPFCFVLPIGLTRVDEAGICNRTDRATGCPTIKDFPNTVKVEYRQLKIPQTESLQ
jgi:hypothetical protein